MATSKKAAPLNTAERLGYISLLVRTAYPDAYALALVPGNAGETALYTYTPEPNARTFGFDELDASVKPHIGMLLTSMPWAITAVETTASSVGVTRVDADPTTGVVTAVMLDPIALAASVDAGAKLTPGEGLSAPVIEAIQVALNGEPEAPTEVAPVAVAAEPVAAEPEQVAAVVEPEPAIDISGLPTIDFEMSQKDIEIVAAVVEPEPAIDISGLPTIDESSPAGVESVLLDADGPSTHVEVEKPAESNVEAPVEAAETTTEAAETTTEAEAPAEEAEAQREFPLKVGSLISTEDQTLVAVVTDEGWRVFTTVPLSPSEDELRALFGEDFQEYTKKRRAKAK